MNALWAIVGPTATSIKGVQMLDITIQSLLRKLAAVFLQPEICKDSKPEPVCVGHTVIKQLACL